MLILHPAFQLPPYVLPREPQTRLRPNKPLTRPAYLGLREMRKQESGDESIMKSFAIYIFLQILFE
jgi:hypothetical protein